MKVRWGLLFFLLAVPALAQQAPPSDVTAIIRQFQSATIPWLTVGERVASSLFGILAAIEFGITFCLLALGQADVTVWSATVVRKFMTIGAFYALLLLGPGLMESIINSYVQFGSMASGVPSITPGDIMADGLDIAGSLLTEAVKQGLTLSFVSALLMVACAFMIGWSFVKLVKGFVIAKIESYITIYAAVIQLGWGGSRFTSIYADRYVGAAMATGIKLMSFYLVVGVERSMAPTWIEAAKQVPLLTGGVMPTLTLTASIVLFCTVADADKIANLLFSGQPQFTGHDVSNAYMPVVNAGISAGTSAVTLGAGLAGGGTVLPFAAGAAASGASSAASAATSRPQSTPPKPPETKA